MMAGGLMCPNCIEDREQRLKNKHGKDEAPIQATTGDDAAQLLFLFAQSSARRGVGDVAGLGIACWTTWEPKRINAAVEALRVRGWVNVLVFPPAAPYDFHTVAITDAGMKVIEKAVPDMRSLPGIAQ